MKRRKQQTPLEAPKIQIDFEQIEVRAGLRLKDGDRAAIKKMLREYAEWRARNDSGEGVETVQALAKVIKATEALEECLTALEKEPGHLHYYIAYRGGFDYTRERKRLRNLRLSTVRVKRKGHGRRPDFKLGEILQHLSSLYSAATNGRSTRITSNIVQGKKVRKSAFVDFAFDVLGCLPNIYRPHSLGALAATWERQYLDREAAKFRTRSWIGSPRPRTGGSVKI